MTLEEVLETKKYYINSLREYSRKQVDLWRQVPWLALQAQGRSGWSDAYGRCIRNGIWTINSATNGGYCATSVDCDSGELMYFNKPMRDNCKELMLIDPKELDASLVIAYLNQRILNDKEDHSIKQKGPTWRKDTAEELGIERVYHRTRTIPEPSWSYD
ncbi:hypothetical protein EVB64_109 [Rhizobium phage RHph_TM61]|nr:hypothetical protein EVB64_109 [Rhizobium phage RHph_TM61]